jgi:hypothetical protein
MTTYYVKQGDTAPVAAATLLDPSGAAVSLSGAAVVFHMVDQARAVVVNAAAIIDPDQVGNKGKVTYQWILADTDTAGIFLAEWQVTFAGGAVQTFPNLGYDTVQIDAQLA